MTENLLNFDVLTEIGGYCVLLVLGGAVGGVVLGSAIGGLLGWFGARPLMRWGLGEDRIVGCLATGVLVVGGVAGGLWAGAWAGTAVCANYAIGDRFLLEDLVISSLVMVTTDGSPSGDPERDGRRMREAVEEAGGSLRQLLEQVVDEVQLEAPGTELPGFLSPEIVADLMAAVEQNELFDPEAMVKIAAGGGLALAEAGSEPGLAAYAQRVIAIGEPVRREVLLGINAAAISNAVVTAVVAIAAPFALLFLIAGITRLIRKPGHRADVNRRRTRQPRPGAQ